MLDTLMKVNILTDSKITLHGGFLMPVAISGNARIRTNTPRLNTQTRLSNKPV